MALPELNTARYEMVIPSTGETVSYRPYLVKEEKILMMTLTKIFVITSTSSMTNNPTMIGY